VKISVVICAYTMDRWNDVLDAVHSVAMQRFAPHEIILVIDHNPSLLERLAVALPDVAVMANAGPQGLSGGKNTGVAAAGGDIVAFLDDDAIAEPDWLAVMAEDYQRPEVSGVGGLTLPLWAGPRPRWFPDEFAWVVGCTYRGMTPGPIRNLMGGNASFRREVFDLVEGFRSGIGRSHGKRPLGCEETEFCIRLNQAAPETVLLFDDRAVIRHRVPVERATHGYFRTRCYAEGLSKAMVTRSVGTTDGLASERRHAMRALPRGVVAGLRATARGDWSGSARAASIVAGLAYTTAGYAVGSRRGAVDAAAAPGGESKA
jgi:glucosyl-dolichyl phosphate glucuronosyltransferase